MIDRIEAPDASTVVFHLKFPTAAFLPALADPMSWIYQKAILDKDMHWYEKNIMGSGPFKFAGYEAGQSIKGVRNPDYYIPGPPISTGSRASTHPSRRPASMRCAPTVRQSSFEVFRRACGTNSSQRLTTRSRSRRQIGTAAT